MKTHMYIKETLRQATNRLNSYVVFLHRNQTKMKMKINVCILRWLPIMHSRQKQHKLLQHCWLNNVVTTRLSWLNNVVERTMFTIASTMLLNEQCPLLFQQCSSVLMKQQRLFTVVETGENNIDSQKKLLRYCYHCCSTLLTSCNSING